MSDYALSKSNLLGEGAFGAAYKCSTPPGKPFRGQHPVCVVKVIAKEKAGEDAVREAAILKSCDNGFIVRYLEAYRVRSSGDIHIVMEHCDRGTLTGFAGRLRTEEPQVWRLLSQLSDALAYLHGRSPPVMHRDLKPDNILGKTVGGGITWKLADFGMAKLLSKGGTSRYYAASCCGTPIYMAPEVLKAEHFYTRYGTAADVWSLGAVMAFFCSSGRHLFPSEKDVAKWTGKASPLDGKKYSADVCQVVSKMVSPGEGARPSAGSVLTETRKNNRQQN